MQKRDLKEVGKLTKKDLEDRITEIRGFLKEESFSSPSRFAPCFQAFKSFSNPDLPSNFREAQLVNVANGLYASENCWFEYMLNLLQCDAHKSNPGACFMKFKPKELYCFSQSKENLNALQEIVQKKWAGKL